MSLNSLPTVSRVFYDRNIEAQQLDFPFLHVFLDRSGAAWKRHRHGVRYFFSAIPDRHMLPSEFNPYYTKRIEVDTRCLEVRFVTLYEATVGK